jgi:hypothetical protein
MSKIIKKILFPLLSQALEIMLLLVNLQQQQSLKEKKIKTQYLSRMNN